MVEYLLNNMASLAVIPIVLVSVLKLKGAQIDSLKQQNETLKSQISGLERSRPSEMAADYDVVKKYANKIRKKFQNVTEKLDKLKIKIKQKEQLDKKDIDLVSSAVGLTQTGLSHYVSGPPFWLGHWEESEKKKGRIFFKK